MKKTVSIIFLLFVGCNISAAQTPWSLQQCIDYAVNNNISVQQMVLRTENAALQLNTAQNSKLPNFYATLGQGAGFGRGENREGLVVDNTTLTTNMGLSADIAIFQGFRIKNNIGKLSFDFRASLEDLEKAKEDLALNVTGYYLQALLTQDLIRVAEQQLELSRKNVERSTMLYESGSTPQSTIYESRALQASDELNLVRAQNNFILAMLNLRQALNLEDKNFTIPEPDINILSLDNDTALESPENIFDYAVDNKPVIEAERLRLESSRKSLLVAKASRYPSIGLGVSYGNSYYYSFIDGYPNKPFFDQLGSNGRESISFSVRIPIFSAFSTRNNIRAASLAISGQELALASAKQILRQDIEQAYYSAIASLSQFEAAGKSLEAAREAFRYEEIKAVEGGRSTIYDFDDARTRMERAQSDLLQAKYEFLFRSKILDYYAGRPLEFDNY